jgi:protein PhnA
MTTEYKCPKCTSENVYEDGGDLWICPDCSYEWNPTELQETAATEIEAGAVKDANGNVLQNGDSVTVIKDLKVKGSVSGIKSGTKVRNIHLVDGHDGHNISCRIEGIGAMYLKSEFVRKVQ